MKRAVFLDRDGVINRPIIRDGRSYPPPSMDAFEFLPGVADAAEELKRAGFTLIVATNQPDVATGVQKREVVEAMHMLVKSELAVDDIKVCYHVDRDGCSCRKSKPGMLLESAVENDLNLADSFMVGDRWRDVAAGKAAGCRTILIAHQYDERQAEDPDFVANSLPEACQWILEHESNCIERERESV